MSNDLKLQANRITYYRGDQLILKDLSFSVSAGELLQIVGPNGSGKTTLLRILTGILSPNSGEVLLHHQFFSYLGHYIGVKDDLTIIENLQLPYLLPKKLNERIDNLLLTFNLHQIKHRLARSLSRGQRQRIALVKLILLDAPLWILDEPFSALDSVSMDKVQQLLAKKVASGGAIILTSHREVNRDLLSPQVIDLSNALHDSEKIQDESPLISQRNLEQQNCVFSEGVESTNRVFPKGAEITTPLSSRGSPQGDSRDPKIAPQVELK